jgi:uncharacterized protein YaiI (UPF0178 family)
MKLFIDGDGSPVKNEAMEIASAYGIETVLVTSIDHYSDKETPENVRIVYVDKGFDSADFKIMSMIKRGDVLVTQDYGLASLALAKGARVLHHYGFEYTNQNIDNLLANRYMGQMERKSGGRTKGPKSYTAADRDHFEVKLNEMLSKGDSQTV